KVYITQVRQWDPEMPTVLCIRVSISVFVDFAAELKANLAEPEGLAILPNGLPEITHGSGGGQRLLKFTQHQLTAQHAPESAAHQQTPGYPKLHVTQMLDTQPGRTAEQQDNHPLELVAKQALQQGEDSTESTDSVEDQDHPARGKPEIQQPMMDVPAVGRKQRLVAQEPAD